jgi:hypothetical protein
VLNIRFEQLDSQLDHPIFKRRLVAREYSILPYTLSVYTHEMFDGAGTAKVFSLDDFKISL